MNAYLAYHASDGTTRSVYDLLNDARAANARMTAERDALIGALRDAVKALVVHAETCEIDDCWQTQTYERVSAVLDEVSR
jgi:hypothetical protein